MLNSTWTDFFAQLAASGLYEDKLDDLATFVADSSNSPNDFIDFEKSSTVVYEHLVVLLYFDNILCIRRAINILNVQNLTEAALIYDISDQKSIS